MAGKYKDYTGLKFGLLTLIEPSDKTTPGNRSKRWLAKCDCGNELIIIGRNLNDKSSCGCSIKEWAKNLGMSNRQYEPKIQSAKAVFARYNDGNLKFEEFYKLSQENCTYCNAKPDYKSNVPYRYNGNVKYHDDGEFIYNGLDRVDNNQLHNLNNIVTCCGRCNTMKLNYSVEEFKNLIRMIIENVNKEKIYKDVVIPKYIIKRSGNGGFHPIMSSASTLYCNIYKDGNLSLDDFYILSQQNCHYCGREPSNSFNRASKTSKKYGDFQKEFGLFIYNGLDRIDSVVNTQKIM